MTKMTDRIVEVNIQDAKTCIPKKNYDQGRKFNKCLVSLTNGILSLLGHC